MSRTINYKEKYEKALERARVYWETDNDNTLDIKAKGTMEHLFPELRESKNEMIRKRIIQAIKIREKEMNEEWSNEIAWLEKQGNKPHGKSALEAAKEEKVDNTNKVEPKFKVGDCLTDGTNIRKIIAVGTGLYVTEKEDGTEVSLSVNYVERNYHLWTIQDAKDGDVLCTYECCEPKIVFILKGTPKKHYALSYHCYYNIMYPHFDSDSKKGCLRPNDEDVKPATKEQRDLLFQKMNEAGYTFDFEKKELKH